MAADEPTNLAQSLDGLKPKDKSPSSARVLHASTDPHAPPAFVNDRARDVVDLLLLRDPTETTECPSLTEIRAAVEDIFAVRAAEAEATDALPRKWRARLAVHRHWGRASTKPPIPLG